ncbi:PAS domain S-box protein [Methanospirillum sp.]|uniref:PAS domain S-box protein n=1 Tax=Methanospirillum sp. TaxID=45200 RepID=UPI002D1FB7CD|nr:PAS domain S-box protein [Methanospirillum sp.]
MLGSSRKTLIGQTPAEIHPTYALPLIMSDFEKMRSGEVMFISNIPMQRKDGSIFYADVHSSPLELDGQPALLGVFHDCTDRILADEENKLHLTRLQSFLSLLGMVDSSEKEIMSYALAQSLQITKSRYAFIGTLTPDESEMIIHAWSDNVMELCKIQDKPMRFPLHNAGIWGNCIRIRTASIMNDYSLPDPAKHGYPEGHVQITRFLGVPIFDNDTIVAILAVANKETEYQDDDVNALQTLGSMMWEIIRRRRTEEDLLRQHEALLSAYEEIRVSEEELRQNYDEIAANRQELIERERQLQLKLDSILTPEYDITEEEFGNIIDSHEIQLLMDDFYALTHIGIAILDLKGNILVATGWQDICTKFHRVNEESAKNCRDSDIFLTTNVKPGQYLVYKCKNNMWDMVTPIFLGEKHMGNLFLGQFFFDDEVPDREVFTAQAERFGFDTDEYLAALDRVPRWSRETVTTVMDFYTRFSSLISQLSYRNVSLARALLDQKRMAAELRASKDRLTNIIQNTPAGYFRIDRGGNFVDVNDAWLHMHKYHDRSEVIGKHFSITQVDENIVLAQRNVEKMLSGESVPFGEFTRRCKDGSIGVHIFSAIPVREDGKIVGIEGFLIDITHKKRSEEELIRSESEKRSIIQTIPDLIWLKDPDGVFLSCNRAFERLYGAKEQEIVGKTDYDFVDKELADFFREHDQRAMAADRPCVNEEWLTFAEDGYHGLFETIKTPMKDPEGRIIGILGIARDITNRKRIEDALRESEERFRGLMDTITSGVATYTVQGDGSKGKDYIIKDFNRMALEIEGKTLEEVVGKSLADLRPNIDEYGLIPVFQQVWKTGIPAYYPQKIYIDDKYANWYENRIFKLESGEIVAVYNDVTEQKRAEEALQESRDLLDATQKLTRIGGWEWHVGRQTMTWTIETYRIHEIDPDEIPPGSPDLIALSLSCYDPEDRPVIRDAFELCATKGISYDMIFPFTTTKGKRIWIRTAAEAIVADGKVIRVIGNIMDITDQKLTEEALHESEEKYRLIADNTADHIWISDMNLKLTYSSPSVLKMKGFTAQETLEQSLDEMLTPASVEMVLKLFKKEMMAELNGTTDPNRTIYFITEEYCKDGSVIFVENSAILLRDTDGRPTSILGISRDITERKKMEDALKQSNQKLRLLTSLTRHDILNLINSINGFLELASMSSDLKESCYYISKCREAGDRIEMTIGFTREYEDFGIISSGWVQVVPVIRSAWGEVNPTEIRFESEISSSLEIFADPLIRKVFSTLIENSVRHGQRTTFIRFSEMFTDNACIIVCEDDGIGILENEKDLIFEHGYGKHTGIGLFLSREILSITGLSIHECGEKGKGARFEITVPKGKFRIKAV